MDFVSLGETMVRYSPPFGETLESATTYHVDIGGTESNVAAALARLGLSAGWISRLPDNFLGRRVAGQLRRHGVDTSRVIWAPGERIGTYYIEMSRQPRPAEILYDRKDSALSRIQPEEVDWEYVRSAEWLHLTGITMALGDGPGRTCERAIEEAAGAGATVSFDVNYRAKLWSSAEASAAITPLLSRVDILFCAARDAAQLFGVPLEAEEAVRALYERFGLQIAIVTEGGAGAVAYDGAVHRVAAVPAETLDPIGTGDAFDAGFIAGYREGGIDQGLEWGSALAALKRTYRSDQVWCGMEELQMVLSGITQGIRR